MICGATVEGGRAGVSRGGWHTLTSAIFHFGVTDWLQMGPCRLFSAVLGSAPTGCALSSRPRRGRGLHPNCQSQEASGCYKRTLTPKDPLSPLSGFPQFEDTLALDFAGAGCVCTRAHVLCPAELGYSRALSLREAEGGCCVRSLG